MTWYPTFGTRKSAGFSLQDLMDEVAVPTNPHYAAWAARPGGAASADKLIRDVYTHLHHKPGYTLETLTGGCNGKLRLDNQKYITNSQTLMRYAARAATGFYSRALNQRGNWSRGMGFTAGQRKSEYERAADWVMKSSSTLNKQGTGSKVWKDLVHAMEVVVETQDVTSTAALELLHTAVGDTTQNNRISTTHETFYGTSALGQHFLPLVMNAARPYQTQTFLNARPKAATDLAVFLMLGAILAHSFGDGNGRSARMLYACTQIRNGVRFVPAAYTWVLNQQHERNIDTIVHAGEAQFVIPATPAAPTRFAGRARGHRVETVDIAAERAREEQNNAMNQRIHDLLM